MGDFKRVLSIDPGSRKIGYGVVDFSPRTFSHVASGVLDYSAIKNYFNRLPLIYKKTLDIVEEFSPDEMALEALIYVKSPSSLIKLAHARGAVIAGLSMKTPDKVYEYAPNLVKATVVGHGHASKEMIQKAVSIILGKREYASDDESDALAVAICHALHNGTRNSTQQGRVSL